MEPIYLLSIYLFSYCKSNGAYQVNDVCFLVPWYVYAYSLIVSRILLD